MKTDSPKPFDPEMLIVKVQEKIAHIRRGGAA